MDDAPPVGFDLCAMAAGKPPNGLSNFDDPPTLQATYISVTTIMTTLSVVMVFGRLYVNRNKMHAADRESLLSLHLVR